MNQPSSTIQTAAPRRSARVAVFDLDGTLLSRDSFLPFLVSYAVARRRYWRLVAVAMYTGAYVLRMLPDWRAKEKLLSAIFGGEPESRIEEHARRFCDRWVSRHLHPLGLSLLRDHQARGDRVILLSASPDLYVPAVARYLGIDEVVSTRVARQGGRCLGHLQGYNCKGIEKIVQLNAYLDRDSVPAANVVAYGDSRSDLPLLRWAGAGFRLTRRSCSPIRENLPANAADAVHAVADGTR